MGGKVNKKNKANDGNIKNFKFFSSLLNIADNVYGVGNIIKKSVFAIRFKRELTTKSVLCSLHLCSGTALKSSKTVV
jgi:hypothetical protein